MAMKLLAWLTALASVIAFILVYFSSDLPTPNENVLYVGPLLSSSDECVLVRPRQDDAAAQQVQGRCQGVFQVILSPDDKAHLNSYTFSSFVPRQCARGTLLVGGPGSLPQPVPVTRCFRHAPEPWTPATEGP